MIARLIERLTGRTRRTAQPRRASAGIPVEKRAELIEARIRADMQRRDIITQQLWDEVQAIAGHSRRAETQADAVGHAQQEYHQP